MQRKLQSKIIITLCFLMVASMSYAQSIIKGVVKDKEGKALERAMVSIPSLIKGTYTNANGEYQLVNLPDGRYNVEVSYMGYDNESESVTVKGNETVTTNFNLGGSVKSISDIVVTGVSNPKSSLESSISISSLKMNDINNAVPRTTAEIFRTIPGIRSESSGGDGNSNITVRGVPVSAGGSRYMLLQEDGLPVLQFGDVSFGTQDQFLRFDANIGKVEALRGGSASVLASNSPAGIINFISKTGETTGGSISTNMGLDYNNYRTDFEYGTGLGNDVFFHVGGFYRMGDGPRKTGYTSNNGGQIKANLTKKFNKGYVRLYVKALDDRTAAYMPMPIEVSGTNAAPKWSSLSAYDAFNGALQSPYLQNDLTMGGNGNKLNSDVADGMHSKSNSVGAEFAFDLGNGWRVTNKARVAFNKGQFIAPFPADVKSAGALLNSIDSTGKMVYAGTNDVVDANATAMRIHLFNTTLNNFNNYTNDLNVSKRFDIVKVNAGLYKAIQNVSMSWNWNTYLMEANTANRMQLLDVMDSSGNKLTTNGLLAYGTPAWGNCCNRNYDTRYDITAPYASIEIEPSEKINIDAGVRYDYGKVNGSFSGGNSQTASIDMNGNGMIDLNEVSVAITSSVTTPVDYNYGIFSYSVGANYMINNNQSVFIRTSKGGSASADRILFSGYNYASDTDQNLNAQKVNTVAQTELGYKYRKNNVVLNATAFLATTKESNYEATTQKKINNTYQSIGLELDAVVAVNKEFSFRGGLTYTHAKIKDAKDTSVIGNTPRRLPAIMFNITPNYSFKGGHNIGFTLMAFTKSFAQDNNKLVMPGYMVLNPYVNFSILKNLSFGLAGNNVLNGLGITEAEEGAITENVTNIVRARPITGRSISASLRFQF